MPVAPVSAAPPGSRSRLEVVAQTHQVHISQVVGAGRKDVLIINAETVIQLEADPQSVINSLIVTAVDVLQAVAHKVWLNRFHRVLTNREGITGEVLNPPGIPGELVVNIGFFGGHKVLIPTATEGEGPVIRLPAQRRTEDILIIGFVVCC